MRELTSFPMHNDRGFYNRDAKSCPNALVAQTNAKQWVYLMKLTNNLFISTEVSRVCRVTGSRRYDYMTEFAVADPLHWYVIISGYHDVFSQFAQVLVQIVGK